MANNQGAENPAKPLKSLGDVQIPNWMAAVIILGLVAVLGVAFWLLNRNPAAQTAATPQTTQFASEASPDADQVEVLPQTARSFDGDGVKNPFTAESLGEIRVAGVMTNSNGKGTAIIEAQGVSYIVSTGDTLSESSWVVESIGSNSVTFSNKGSEKTIYMDGQNNGAEVGK